MTPALEGARHEGVEDVLGDPYPDHARAEAEHVRVVVGAGGFRGERVGAERGTNAVATVGRDRHADAGATHEQTEAPGVGEHGVRDARRPIRVVGARRVVRPEILDLVPTGGSDFHGRHKPHIALGEGDGTIDMRYATWERLQEKRR